MSAPPAPFSVWAPLPDRVRLALDDRVIPMSKGDDGWWTPDEAIELPATGDCTYGFVVDDDRRPLPDPRSRRQPHGVHARSRTFDPARFEWTDSGWTGRRLAGSVVYELHVGTFTPGGTLDSAIRRLPHLVDLGVGFVELLPVNTFNGTRNWGYDGVLWYAVDESYGGPAAYQRFVDACHGHGLAVIQDVVYNHLGPSGNYLPRFGPYLRDDRSNTWGKALDLEVDAVRRYILDNAAMWFGDYHVDGLRLDAVHALVDHSDRHILAELADATDALETRLARPLTLIAESDLNDEIMITRRPGYGIDAQWDDDFHHAVHVALTGETGGYYADFDSLASLAKVLTRGFFHDGTFSSFRGRRHGRPLDRSRVQGWQLVVASQTHDQVGNRAAGERLSMLVDTDRAALAALLTLTAPFTPMLFMGEEWGASTPWQFFTAHAERDLGEIVARGRIEEFDRMAWDVEQVPDPQALGTFLRSKLDWSELGAPDHGRLLDLYRRLIALRAELPDLVDFDLTHVKVEFEDDDLRWLAIHRNRTSVIVNLAVSRVTLPFAGDVVLATADGVTVDRQPDGDGGCVALPGVSGCVLVH